jgi:hypothetical protein
MVSAVRRSTCGILRAETVLPIIPLFLAKVERAGKSSEGQRSFPRSVVSQMMSGSLRGPVLFREVGLLNPFGTTK